MADAATPNPAVTALLRNGETLRWTGRPDPSIRFGRADLILVPFTLVWGGFALAWNIAVWSSGAPLPFRLFGLPFLAVGYQITIGRFVVQAKRKRTTTYAVTSQRAIIVDDRGQERFVELTSVLHDTVSNARRGSISVSFRSPDQSTSSRWATFDQRLSGIPSNLGTVASSYFCFVDVTDREALLRALASAPSAA